jgi:hypothetical protein
VFSGESSGHNNICLHPRSSYINFNYYYLRAAIVDNILQLESLSKLLIL